MKKLTTVLFDFDGVLSKGRFYNTIADDYIKDGIRNKLFTKEAWPLIEKWMKGILSYKQIHKLFASELGTTVKFLNRNLKESVKAMALNQELIEFAGMCREKGIKTAIFTDNMDIFEEVTVPSHGLDKKFDFIFSSSSYGKLKLDDNAEFLKYVISQTESKFENTLFIDDSPKIGISMVNNGGYFYQYENYEIEFPKFIKWFYSKFVLND